MVHSFQSTLVYFSQKKLFGIPPITSSNPRGRRLKTRVTRLKARVGRLKARVRRLKAQVEAIKPRVK